MDREELVFTIEVRTDGGVSLVAPHGELDMGTQEELRTVLHEQAATGDVTLDLAGVSFLDTSGLRLILETAQMARRDGFRFTVLPGSPSVQRLFEIAGVLELVPFRDDAEGAGP
jgi:anti-anti-sigma factor